LRSSANSCSGPNPGSRRPWSDSAAGQPRDQAWSLGLLREDAHLAAELLQQALDPADALALVARRIARVEAQQRAQQLDRMIVKRVWAHRDSLSDLAISDVAGERSREA